MSPIPGAVFHRVLDKQLPLAGRSKGAWIETADGRRFLDASGGAVVVNVGHGREEIARAVYDQLVTLSYVHPTMFATSAVEDLAAALAAHAPAGLDRFYFMSSGSEAVETAVKLARQIHLARGNPERQVLVSRWKSYHGLTMGALAAAGRTSFRLPFYPMLRDAVHIPPPYCLRCSYGLSFPACGLRCALALDETIQNIGPPAVSAFIAETVGGASIAVCPPPEGYWPLVREICDRHGVLLILDEVMCGMGRTGKWFAAGHYGVVPDLLVLGKGLSGGTLALSAVATTTALMEAVRASNGNFAHGGTFSHSGIACAAGLAAVRILERDNLVERAADLGRRIGERLHAALADSPRVADIRGIGMMWGVEFVQDRQTLKPFPRSEKLTERLWQALFDQGVILYKSIGMAGTDGDGLIVAPPFVITEDEIDLVADRIDKSLRKVLPA
ncbi:MAG: aspartate aminotransferase family protein [Desulfobacterales bacterium]|jgi:adenosylmethionine-8-amino-7-oxononanoate aminotransferase|nr:aspartate aminotransferase family protein [Desulfobacterales bacterium]